MKKIIFIMFMLPLFICGMCSKDDHWSISVANKSDLRILFNCERVTSLDKNTFIPKPVGVFSETETPLGPHQNSSNENHIRFRSSFEDIFSSSDSVRVYFYNAATYKEIVGDRTPINFDFSDPRIYLGYKSYTWDDLERLNWQITYPF